MFNFGPKLYNKLLITYPQLSSIMFSMHSTFTGTMSAMVSPNISPPMKIKNHFRANSSTNFNSNDMMMNHFNQMGNFPMNNMDNYNDPNLNGFSLNMLGPYSEIGKERENKINTKGGMFNE
jgi:hypothetical protein